jgi:hypothetical protein
MQGALDGLLTGTSEGDGLLRSSGLQRQVAEAAIHQSGQGGFVARLREDKCLLEVPLCQRVVPRIVRHPAGEISQARGGTEHFFSICGRLGAKKARRDLDGEMTDDGAVYVRSSEHPVSRTELSEKLDVMGLLV